VVPCDGPRQLRALDSRSSAKLVTLPTAHPEVAHEFEAGSFTIQKMSRQFSAIPIDQAQEQNNAAIKGHGGAVGVIDKPTTLR